MTTTFYAPPESFDAGQVWLPEAEARHAVKVLRLRPGAEITVVDGEGGWHRVLLEEAGRSEAQGRVVETRREVGEMKDLRLVLALAPLRQGDRFETALEKAVELGVTDIFPVRTTRTEPGRIKRARIEGILVAAMKQSLRSRLPILHEEASPESLFAAFPDALHLLCHEAAEPEAAMLSVLRAHASAPLICVHVGPEGGFTLEEIARAEQAGARIVSLGARRLRAETAAITALSAVMLSYDLP